MYILGNSEKNELIRPEEANKYYDEKIEIDINDKNNTHSIIAKYIKDGSTVLDVGCGAGYIGNLLKGKKCNVYGIDLDEKSLEVAMKYGAYKDAKCFSATKIDDKQIEILFNKKIKFDYVIFADVLEHLKDPGKVLLNASSILKPDGEILASVPNIAHLDIIKGLMDRKFNYNKIGILDNTHLRFFTESSFVEMIDSMNKIYESSFSLKKIGQTINYPDYIEKYPNIIGLLNEDDRLFVLQNVFSIKKSKKVSLPKEKELYLFDLVEKTINDYRVENENMRKQIADLTVQNNALKEEINNINNRKIMKVMNAITNKK